MPRHSAPSCLSISPKLSNIFGKRTKHNADDNFEFNESEYMNQLQMSIEALRSTTVFTLKAAEAQEKCVESLEKWAKQTPNEAIGDITGWTCELFRVHAKYQRIFVQNYQHFLLHLQNLTNTELNIQKEEQQFKNLAIEQHYLKSAYYISKNKEENKIILNRKSISSLPKDSNEINSLWCETVGELMIQKTEIKEKREKAEIIKMKEFKEAIKGIANSHCNFANATNLIFSCQRDLAEFVPNIISPKDIGIINYDGITKTQKRMNKLGKELELFDNKIPQYNKQLSIKKLRPKGEQLSNYSQANIKNNLVQRISKTSLTKTNNKQFGTPPPPYTPSAPPIEQIDLNSEEEEKQEEKLPRMRIYPSLSQEKISNY